MPLHGSRCILIQVTASLWCRPLLAPRLHLTQAELGTGQSERRTRSRRDDLRQCTIMTKLGASVDGRGRARRS
jgi:hypothetical protein